MYSQYYHVLYSNLINVLISLEKILKNSPSLKLTIECRPSSTRRIFVIFFFQRYWRKMFVVERYDKKMFFFMVFVLGGSNFLRYFWAITFFCWKILTKNIFCVWFYAWGATYFFRLLFLLFLSFLGGFNSTERISLVQFNLLNENELY